VWQIPPLNEPLQKLLKELSKIPDPRQPKKVKHKLTVVLLYGLLSFVLQMAPRREANRELSRPAFLSGYLAGLVSGAGIATACRHAASSVSG
jgi:hypothetical protein